MESDGDEADDEFDQITSSNDVDDRAQQSNLSAPQRVILNLLSSSLSFVFRIFLLNVSFN